MRKICARIYAFKSSTTDNTALNQRLLIELGKLPVEKTCYGYGVFSVFGAEHRCLVRLCGETQRLLEQLEPKVSAPL